MQPWKPAPLTIALIGLCLTALCIAGCVTADCYTAVDADGTISTYRLEVTTSQEHYGLLEESARQDGYAGVAELIEDRGLRLGADAAPVAYDESWDGDRVTMRFSVEGGLSADQLADVAITREGNHLVYRHLIGDGGTGGGVEGEDPFAAGTETAFEVNYYLEMPGPIVDANADAVEGATAEWHLAGADLLGTELYARSEVPAQGMPGFSCWIAFAALCILCCGRTLLR
jgi:hypothetical protein